MIVHNGRSGTPPHMPGWELTPNPLPKSPPEGMALFHECDADAGTVSTATHFMKNDKQQMEVVLGVWTNFAV